MRFFLLNFLNARGILTQKIDNAQDIFRQFFDVISGGRSQQPSILCQLVTGQFLRTGISCPKES